MKERPILFNSAMVRAILRGQKTQTRRLFEYVTTPKGFGACLDLSRGGYDHDNNQQEFVCPFGSIGDRLWVRETFARHPQDADSIFYRADDPWYRTSDAVWANPDGPDIPVKWTPSIHMPRALSRITLEITDTYPERVQDISANDLLKEGFGNRPAARNKFRIAWDLLYFRRGLGWDANPWVWVVEFECVEVR